MGRAGDTAVAVRAHGVVKAEASGGASRAVKAAGVVEATEAASATPHSRGLQP